MENLLCNEEMPMEIEEIHMASDYGHTCEIPSTRISAVGRDIVKSHDLSYHMVMLKMQQDEVQYSKKEQDIWKNKPTGKYITFLKSDIKDTLDAKERYGKEPFKAHLRKGKKIKMDSGIRSPLAGHSFIPMEKDDDVLQFQYQSSLGIAGKQSNMKSPGQVCNQSEVFRPLNPGSVNERLVTSNVRRRLTFENEIAPVHRKPFERSHTAIKPTPKHLESGWNPHCRKNLFSSFDECNIATSKENNNVTRLLKIDTLLDSDSMLYSLPALFNGDLIDSEPIIGNFNY